MNIIQNRKNLFLKRRESRPSPVSSDFYLNAFYENIDEKPILREARAVYAYWANAELLVYPEERIVGFFNADESAGFHYGGTWVKGKSKAADAIRQRGYKYLNPEIFNENELAQIQAHASTSTWFAGHGVLDFEKVLEIGLVGYRMELAMYERNDFYIALETILDGITVLIKRFANLANPESAAALDHIAINPPETFHQALQMVWILHLIDNNDSFGRFDYYLRKFFLLETNRENAIDLLTDFWCKIEAVEEIQNMTIGGDYCELTRLCIVITKELGFKGPNLCLRVTPDMPDDIWVAALECMGSGIGLPALNNDTIHINTLVRTGIAPDVAANYCFAGCNQIMIPGQCNFANDIGMFNVGKLFELTLYGGVDPTSGKQVGALTPTDFTCYEDFYDAFIKQLEYGCEIQVSLHNKDLVERGRVDGFALRTLLTRGCIESGRGFYEGGANYNHVELEMIGITNAADCLYAIKKAVFDDDMMTYQELIRILRSDWINEKNWHDYFKSLPKFGNDHAEVDKIRADISDYLYSWFNAASGPFGGFYVPGEVIFTAHDHCGAVTGATPDGRKAGDVLADSVGASQGMSQSGPTALMNSVLKLPYADYLLTSVALNMRFLPDMFNTPRAREGVRALLHSFLLQGGMQVQVNVCDIETLKKAQKNPELYQDLVVRVGGYSDYFVRLSKALQDEIITRTGF